MTPHTVTASHPARRIPGESGTWVFLFGDMLVFGAFFVTFLVERAKEPDVFDAARTTLHLGVGVLNTLVLLTSSSIITFRRLSDSSRRMANDPYEVRSDGMTSRSKARPLA